MNKPYKLIPDSGYTRDGNFEYQILHIESAEDIVTVYKYKAVIRISIENNDTSEDKIKHLILNKVFNIASNYDINVHSYFDMSDNTICILSDNLYGLKLLVEDYIIRKQTRFSEIAPDEFIIDSDGIAPVYYALVSLLYDNKELWPKLSWLKEDSPEMPIIYMDINTELEYDETDYYCVGDRNGIHLAQLIARKVLYNYTNYNLQIDKGYSWNTAEDMQDNLKLVFDIYSDLYRDQIKYRLNNA